MRFYFFGVFLLAIPTYGLSLRLGMQSEVFYFGPKVENFISQLENTLNAGDIRLRDSDFNTTFYMTPEKRMGRQAAPIFSGFMVELPFTQRNQMEFTFSFGGILNLPQNTLFYQGPAELNEVKLCTPSNIVECPLARWGFVQQSSGSEFYQLTATGNEFYWGIHLGTTLLWQKKLWDFYGSFFPALMVQYYQLYSRQDFSFQLNRMDSSQNSYALVASWENRGISGRGFSLKPLFVYKPNLPFEARFGFSLGYLWFNNQTQQSLKAIKNHEIYAQSPNFLKTPSLEVTLLGLSLQFFYVWDNPK